MIVFDPHELTAQTPNHFSFGGLDRDSFNRENNIFIDTIYRGANTRIVPIWRSRNFFKESDGKETKPEPLYLSPDESEELIKFSKNRVYLGKQLYRNNQIQYLAIGISELDEKIVKTKLSSKGKFIDLREISPLIGGIEGSILAYARAMIFWHERNGFCSVCGSITISTKSGHQRNCTKSSCASLHFPRTDPAVIMLIKDEDKILLGRQKIWPHGLYSTLAGFVEPGETIEHAVAREVYEESGLIVSNINYLYSQPWPFPSSLMLGFTAIAQTKNINCNDSEIEDAQWFSRDEIINFKKKNKILPRRLSVSRRLIDDWLNNNSN